MGRILKLFGGKVAVTTSAMVDFLYGDLDPFFPVAAAEGDNETENEDVYSDTVSGQNKTVIEVHRELEAVKQKNVELSSQNMALRRNISCLFKTARLELNRKDTAISSLEKRVEVLKAVIAHTVNKGPSDCPINSIPTTDNSLVNPTLPHPSSIVTDDAAVCSTNTYSVSERAGKLSTQTATRDSHSTLPTSQNGLRSHARTPRHSSKMTSTNHRSTHKRGTFGRGVGELETVVSKTTGNKENSHSAEIKKNGLKMESVDRHRRESARVRERQRKRERSLSTADALRSSKHRRCGGERERISSRSGPVKWPKDLRTRLSKNNRQSSDSFPSSHPSTAVSVRDEEDQRIDHAPSTLICTMTNRNGVRDFDVLKKESRCVKQPSSSVNTSITGDCEMCEVGDCGDLEEGEIGDDCSEEGGKIEPPQSTVSQGIVTSEENLTKSDVELIPINMTPVDADPTQNDQSQHNIEQDHSMQCGIDRGEINVPQITLSDNDTSETVIEGGYVWSMDEVKQLSHETAPVPLPLEVEDKQIPAMETSKGPRTPPGGHVEFSSSPLLSPPECVDTSVEPQLEVSSELRAPETQSKQSIGGAPVELPAPRQCPEVLIEMSSPVHVEEDTVTLFPDTELPSNDVMEAEKEEGELSGNEEDVTFSPPTPSSSPYKNGFDEVVGLERQRRDGTRSAGERYLVGHEERLRGKRRGSDTCREQQKSGMSHLRLPELKPYLRSTYKRGPIERCRRRLRSPPPPRRRHHDYHPSPPPPLSSHTRHRLHRRH